MNCFCPAKNFEKMDFDLILEFEFFVVFVSDESLAWIFVSPSTSRDPFKIRWNHCEEEWDRVRVWVSVGVWVRGCICVWVRERFYVSESNLLSWTRFSTKNLNFFFISFKKHFFSFFHWSTEDSTFWEKRHNGHKIGPIKWMKNLVLERQKMIVKDFFRMGTTNEWTKWKKASFRMKKKRTREVEDEEEEEHGRRANVCLCKSASACECVSLCACDR